MRTLELMFSPDAVRILEMLPRKRLVRYKAGARIFHVGDPNESVYYVEIGRIKVSIVSEDGKEAVIALRTPGQFLGVSALMDYRIRIAEATCLVDCQLWRFDRNEVLQLLRENKEFASRFLRYLLELNQQYEEDIAAQKCGCCEKRLARSLLLLARLGESGPSTTIPAVSHQVLAELVGTTRAHITTLMTQFREAGFIDYDRRTLTVCQSLMKVLVRG